MDQGTLWYVILFVFKWLFIGLVYVVLFGLVRAVRREMGLRLAAEAPPPTISPGRLRVIRSGTDRQMPPDTLIALENQATLGADRANNVVLGDRFVSRQHARLRWDGLAWWVEDQNSRNGTFINEQRCAPFQEQPLPFGAQLRVGDMVFELLE